MKKESIKQLAVAAALLLVFVLWTLLICLIDVRDIGPNGSSVGFATINKFVHDLTGLHMTLYTVTDWLGLVPVFFAFGFAILGLIQWIKRKHIREVDYSILVLGGFYIVVLAAYMFFEEVVINYRPVLINGHLEASYPSSTTMLVLCVMPTAIMQFNARIKKKAIRQGVVSGIAIFTVFMLLGRLVSGVHWFTDIVGGALLSAGLIMLYKVTCSLK